MDARSYRVNVSHSPLDFPPIMGLGESSVSYQTEAPHLVKNKVVLMITKKYTLLEMSNGKQHEVLSTRSVYEIPSNEIKTREDVYAFYIDATLSLNETYQYARTQIPLLPNITFPTPPIENYQVEIDRVFHLLHSQN